MKQSRFLFALLLAVLMAVSLIPAATAAEVIDSGWCGDTIDGDDETNASWSLDSDGVLTVSGRGWTNRYQSQGEKPWSAYTEQIKKLVIEEGITRIGDFAFVGCSQLAEISLPEGLGYIGWGVFRDCVSLTSVTFPKSLGTLDYLCFDNCTGLTEIYFTGDVVGTGMGEPFSGVTATAYYPAGNETWETADKSVFGGKLEWVPYTDGEEPIPPDPNGIKAEGKAGDAIDWTLYNDGRMVLTGEGDLPEFQFGPYSYTLPWRDYLEDIKTLTVGQGITSLTFRSFAGCENLIDISLPDTLKRLGYDVFNACTSLESAVIPDSVTELGGAFSACHSLKSAKLPDGLTNLPDGMFLQCGFEEFTIPDTVVTIGSHAFRQCENLKSVTIPEGVVIIGEGAFERCRELTDCVLPESLVSIGYEAFCDTSLEHVDIHANVMEIGEFAFGGADGRPSFTVDEDNRFFSGDGNGALYDKEKTRLIEVPTGFKGEFAIPDTVENFGYALRFIPALTAITIPDSVKTVAEAAFTENPELKTVTFLGHKPTLDPRAFENCTAQIRYPADDPTWAGITDQVFVDTKGDPVAVNWSPYFTGAVGDINGDGQVSNADLVTLARFAVNLLSVGGAEYEGCRSRGDMNGDGTIDNQDLVTLARALVS